MKRIAGLAVASIAAAFVLSAIATFQPFHPAKRQADQVSSFAIVALAILAIGALVFGVVLPRAQNHARTSLILGILSFLFIVAFWSGVPVILGAASISEARQARAAQEKRGMATAGILLSLLAIIATIGVVFGDALNTGGG